MKKYLYRIHLTGFIKRFSGSYVIAENPTDAYEVVKAFLDREEYGYSSDRALSNIEVIADSDEHGDSPYMLFE
jgi:hypothetical protein